MDSDAVHISRAGEGAPEDEASKIPRGRAGARTVEMRQAQPVNDTCQRLALPRTREYLVRSTKNGIRRVRQHEGHLQCGPASRRQLDRASTILVGAR